MQREITLFRLLKEELGDRDDISRIVDWSFDKAPYFVESEYTAGGSLADWAEEQGGLSRVPLEVRLEIVAQVAMALAAAHSVGVLHKDVKPSNVLVAEGISGEVRARLSDFGVGAVTEATRLAEAGITMLGLTERTDDGASSSFSGTRLYTAPEVLEGKPATLQADVYALGVMLYQVVMGDLTRALAPGWRRHVADELLREDVAAAVDGSPERRLGNALRLAERLRSLESRRREREAERREREEAVRLRASLEKGRRRRRVLAVAVVVVALFAAAMAAMSVRVRREAERTQREAERTLGVSTFLQELFEIADPFDTSDPGAVRGTSMTVRELLDRGREKLGADSLNNLAGLLRSKGDYEGAEPLFRGSLEVRRRLLGDEHPDTAESLNNLAVSLQSKGDYEGAEPLYRESLEISRRLLGDEHPYIAISLNNLARLCLARGQDAKAEDLIREALEIYLKARPPDMKSKHWRIANAESILGESLAARGRYEEAGRLLQTSYPVVREQTGQRSRYTRDVLKRLIKLYDAWGKADKAAEYRALWVEAGGERDGA